MARRKRLFDQYDITLEKKYALVRELLPIKPFDEVRKKELPEWERKHALIVEIETQIEACEGLLRPLSEEEIEYLCTMQSPIQVANYCRPLKFA